MTNDDTQDPYTLPDNEKHPATIAARLMLLPEHVHLSEHDVSFGWLVRGIPKEKGGKTELGSVHAVKTMFQGQFKDLGLMMLGRMLGYVPEFIVIVDGTWWSRASDVEREALIFHELCHVKQSVDEFGGLKFDRDGNPVFRIVEHDVTAFNAEVARYGAWTPDLQSFIPIAREAS